MDHLHSGHGTATLEQFHSRFRRPLSVLLRGYCMAWRLALKHIANASVLPRRLDRLATGAFHHGLPSAGAGLLSLLSLIGFGRVSLRTHAARVAGRASRLTARRVQEAGTAQSKEQTIKRQESNGRNHRSSAASHAANHSSLSSCHGSTFAIGQCCRSKRRVPTAPPNWSWSGLFRTVCKSLFLTPRAARRRRTSLSLPLRVRFTSTHIVN